MPFQGEMYVQPTQGKQWNITRDVIPFTWYEVCVLAFTTQSGSDPSAVKKVMTSPDGTCNTEVEREPESTPIAIY